ncbi:hypothetical protein CRE_21600 [Caenorhabditis remanei]|uniref:RING-type domain-containing protein n=1 Tax=Caenorhabditis remanei TaxID=31234 RepID=E3NLZ6_CAERE|nr:hypothetical protein CRE_21600 [Caenorhabditis remanei]
MSKIVDSENFPIISPDDFSRISCDYVLDMVRGTVKSEYFNFSKPVISKEEQKKSIELMFDGAGNLLGMYGSVEEHAENLEIYRNFPESHRFFGTNPANPYFTFPRVYESLKNEKYICKPDLFIILEDSVVRAFKDLQLGVYCAFLASFLKEQAEKVSKKLEFVKNDPRIIPDIMKEFLKAMDYCMNILPKCPNTVPKSLTNLTLDAVYKQIMKLIPNVKEEKVYKSIYHCLDCAFKQYQKETHSQLFNSMFFVCKTLVNTLQDIIKKRPELFLPNSSVKNQKSPLVTVRLFEDGEERFVMKAELYEAMNIYYKESFDHGYQTMDIEEVFERFKEQVTHVEFIRTPILRAKHKAVPVKGPNTSDFCMLAVDGLFDLLKQLTFGTKFFQAAGGLNAVFGTRLEELFQPELKSRYFVNMNFYLMEREHYKQFLMLCGLASVKPIRNAKKDGFTVQNLKNELKHVNFTGLFPEIEDYAEVAYNEVMLKKKGEFLRTCDLFDAIEHCVLLCIFNRVPEMKSFLHNQKSCWRVVGLKCELCDEKDPNEKSLDHQLDLKMPEKNVENKGEIEKQPNPCQNKLKDKEQMLAEIEKQLADAKVRSEQNVEALKKDLEKEEEENEKLRSQSVLHAKLGKENDEMRKKLAKHEISEKQMRKAGLKQKKIFDETLTQLRQQVADLEEELSRENQVIKDLDQQIIHLNLQNAENHENSCINENWAAEKQCLEKKIVEKTRRINELNEQKIVLRTENEVNSRMVQSLLNKLADVSIAGVTAASNRNQREETSTPPLPLVQTPPPSTSSSMSSAPEATGSTSSPASRWRNTQNSSSELADAQCVICLFDMKRRQKTIKCHQCRRRFHSKCASEWLKVKSECPACRGRLLDPYEFPSL